MHNRQNYHSQQSRANYQQPVAAIRAGLSVEELKMMTAMRMASSDDPRQNMPRQNISNPASSYQTATPAQLQAAGIAPVVINDRHKPQRQQPQQQRYNHMEDNYQSQQQQYDQHYFQGQSRVQQPAQRPQLSKPFPEHTINAYNGHILPQKQLTSQPKDIYQRGVESEFSSYNGLGADLNSSHHHYSNPAGNRGQQPGQQFFGQQRQQSEEYNSPYLQQQQQEPLQRKPLASTSGYVNGDQFQNPVGAYANGDYLNRLPPATTSASRIPLSQQLQQRSMVSQQQQPQQGFRGPSTLPSERALSDILSTYNTQPSSRVLSQSRQMPESLGPSSSDPEYYPDDDQGSYHEPSRHALGSSSVGSNALSHYLTQGRPQAQEDNSMSNRLNLAGKPPLGSPLKPVLNKSFSASTISLQGFSIQDGAPGLTRTTLSPQSPNLPPLIATPGNSRGNSPGQVSGGYPVGYGAEGSPSFAPLLSSGLSIIQQPEIGSRRVPLTRSATVASHLTQDPQPVAREGDLRKLQFNSYLGDSKTGFDVSSPAGLQRGNLPAVNYLPSEMAESVLDTPQGTPVPQNAKAFPFSSSSMDYRLLARSLSRSKFEDADDTPRESEVEVLRGGKQFEYYSNSAMLAESSLRSLSIDSSDHGRGRVMSGVSAPIVGTVLNNNTLDEEEQSVTQEGQTPDSEYDYIA